MKPLLALVWSTKIPKIQSALLIPIPLILHAIAFPFSFTCKSKWYRFTSWSGAALLSALTVEY